MTLKYKLLIPAGVALLSMVAACNKSFLDKQPQGAFLPAVLATRPGIDGLLIGAYHMVGGQGGTAGNNWGGAPSNWVLGGVVADDSYKGSVLPDQGPQINPLATWSYNTNNDYLNQKWVVTYDGVQRSNDVLRVLALNTDISAADRTIITAEARFLRGHFHFEAKKVFNNSVYADEKTTSTSNIDAAGNFVDIWPKIEADFTAAIAGLPEVQPQAGRANKSAAKAYLAEVYMYQRKFALAKPILADIIANGQTANGKKYALVNYQNNFNAATDNSAESIFAFQSSVNDGSGTNGNYGDNLTFPNGSGPGGCCGFNNPSMSLANAYKTDANGLPLLDTYNAGASVSDPANPYVGSVDPRIDIVMGRPGIPYYDWGIVPKNAWIRDPSTDGYFSPKKVVYAKSQVGTISSTETSFWGPTQMSAINVNLIRYAEVLLWAAECEIEAGTPAGALAFVNQVRTRAANPIGWVYAGGAVYSAATGTYAPQTTPADNYNISNYPTGAFDDKVYARKAILHEERIEMAMEGKRFFNLRRFDNGTGLMAQTLNAYVAAEKSRPSYFSANAGATFTANKNEYYPIPQLQIDIKNATGTVFLKQNPGY